MSPRSPRLPRVFLIVILAASSFSAQTPARSSPASSLDAGIVSNGMYRNAGLGFSCKIPPGWVLRTEELNAREESDSAAKEEAPAAAPGSSGVDGDKRRAALGRTLPTSGQAAEGGCPHTGCGRVLLAAFSRPPDAMAEDVNSSILIVAESVAAYPGLKVAGQYFGPLGEVAKAQGFKVVNEPYDFLAGTKMVARGDFQKDVGSRVMRQSTLVMLTRGYAVSFTFIGGTEEEVEELLAGLSFVRPASTAHK